MIKLHIASPLLKQGADPAVLDRLKPMLLAIQPLAQAIKDRVQASKFVGAQPRYKGGSGGYVVSREYAAAAGISTAYRRFANSAAFHNQARAKPGQGVSGGMWQGFQVRTYGSNGVIMDFAGSSLGRSSRETGDSYTTKKGQTRTQKKPQVIRNSQKAGTLWGQWKVNVTQPDDRQEDALHGALITQTQVALAKAFGGPLPQEQPYGDATLYRQIVRSWVTK